MILWASRDSWMSFKETVASLPNIMLATQQSKEMRKKEDQNLGRQRQPCGTLAQFQPATQQTNTDPTTGIHWKKNKKVWVGKDNNVFQGHFGTLALFQPAT